MPIQVGSVEVGPSPPPQGETRPRRYAPTADKLVTSPTENIRPGYRDGSGGPSAQKDSRKFGDVTVMAHILQRTVLENPDKKGFGWRDVVRTIEEEKEVTKVVGGKQVKEKKKWSYFELTDYKYLTYNQFNALVQKASSALVKTGHSKHTIFNIFASTSVNWQLIANACALQGITFATAYDSLGEEGLEHSLNEPEVYGLFTNAALLKTVAGVAAKTPTAKVVIYDGNKADVKAGAIEQLLKNGSTVYHLDDFLNLGEDNPAPANLPSPDDTACIMYTSGSTGAPKGVLLSNKNIVASVAGVERLLGELLTPDATFLAYLPLAHIFELAVEMTLVSVGITMGYGQVKTLTDASVRNCVGDIRAFKPSIMIGVPAVWELIRKGIVAKITAGGKLTQTAFNVAYAAKKMFGSKSIVGHVADAVVFNKIKQATGGRLKYAVNGGAPVSHETQEFITLAVTDMIMGYGMTESTALSCILPFSMLEYGTVGVPSPAVEVKLVDFDEAGYHATNDPPQGEVLIRGATISKGYFKRDDLTKEAFTADGWLMTGDIGQWNANGTLSIIDRKKNLVKLSGGEYIAIERLESIYKSCHAVANIAVHASSDANRPMAIIFPNESNLRKLVENKGINVSSSADLDELCKNQAIKDAVLSELNALGKKAGLKPLETLQTVVLGAEEWTPQNGLVTAAQKLNRKAILDKFKNEVDQVYP